jgi:hypothetical protein
MEIIQCQNRLNPLDPKKFLPNFEDWTEAFAELFQIQRPRDMGKRAGLPHSLRRV